MELKFPRWLPLIYISIWIRGTYGQDVPRGDGSHLMSPHADVQLDMMPIVHNQLRNNIHPKVGPHKNTKVHNRLKSVVRPPTEQTSNQSTATLVHRPRKVMLKNISTQKSRRYSAILLRFCAADYRKMADEYHEIWLANSLESRDNSLDVQHLNRNVMSSPGSNLKTVLSPAPNSMFVPNTAFKATPQNDLSMPAPAPGSNLNNMLAPNTVFKAEGQLKNEAILGPDNVWKGSLNVETDGNGTVNMHGEHSLSKEVADEHGNVTAGTIAKGDNKQMSIENINANVLNDTSNEQSGSRKSTPAPGIQLQQLLGDEKDTNKLANFPKDVNSENGRTVLIGNTPSPGQRGLTSNNNGSTLSPGQIKENAQSGGTPKPYSQTLGNAPQAYITGKPVPGKPMGSEKPNNYGPASKPKPVATNTEQSFESMHPEEPTRQTTQTTTLSTLEKALMVFAITDTIEENASEANQENQEVTDNSYDHNEAISADKEASPEPSGDNQNPTENYSTGGEEIHQDVTDDGSQQENLPDHTGGPEAQPEPQATSVSGDTNAEARIGTIQPEPSPDNPEEVADGQAIQDAYGGPASEGPTGGPEEYSQPSENQPQAESNPDNYTRNAEGQTRDPEGQTGEPKVQPQPQVNGRKLSGSYSETTKSNTGDNVIRQSNETPSNDDQNEVTENLEQNTDESAMSTQSNSQVGLLDSSNLPDQYASGQTPPEGITGLENGVDYSQEPQPEPTNVANTEKSTGVEPEDGQDVQNMERTESGQSVQPNKLVNGGGGGNGGGVGNGGGGGNGGGVRNGGGGGNGEIEGDGGGNGEGTTPEGEGNEDVKASTQSENENEPYTTNNDDREMSTRAPQVEDDAQTPQENGAENPEHVNEVTPIESSEADGELMSNPTQGILTAPTERLDEENTEEQSTPAFKKNNSKSTTNPGEQSLSVHNGLENFSKTPDKEESTNKLLQPTRSEPEDHNRKDTNVPQHTDTSTKPSTVMFQLIKLIPHSSTPYASNENTGSPAMTNEVETLTKKPGNKIDATEHETESEKGEETAHGRKGTIPNNLAEESTTSSLPTNTMSLPLGILQPLRTQPKQEYPSKQSSVASVTSTTLKDYNPEMESSERTVPEPEPHISTQKKTVDQSKANLPIVPSLETPRKIKTTAEQTEESKPERQATMSPIPGEMDNLPPQEPPDEPIQNQPPEPQQTSGPAIQPAQNPLPEPQKAPVTVPLPPQVPSENPQGPVAEPQNPIPEPQSPVPEPRNSVPEPQSPLPEPQNPTSEPQNPVPEPQNPVPEPQNPVPEPQNPLSEPQKAAVIVPPPVQSSGSAQYDATVKLSPPAGHGGWSLYNQPPQQPPPRGGYDFFAHLFVTQNTTTTTTTTTTTQKPQPPVQMRNAPAAAPPSGSKYRWGWFS